MTKPRKPVSFRLEEVEVVDAPPSLAAIATEPTLARSVADAWLVSRPRQMLTAAISGTPAVALPIAAGAALARRGRPVVCVTDPDGLRRCIPDLALIRRLGLAVTVVVVDPPEAAPANGGLDPVADAERPGPPSTGSTRHDDGVLALASAIGLPTAECGDIGSIDVTLADGWADPRVVDLRRAQRAVPTPVAAQPAPSAW